MKELEKKLKDLDALLQMPVGKEREAKFQELYSWFSAHKDEPDVRKAMPRLLDQKIDETKEEIVTLRDQLGEVYDLLPLSYIAEMYFGKTKAWLYQRLNGYEIRGHRYTLSDEQKQVFNRACQDLGRRIGSFCLA
jgi:transcription termination factor NusB